MNQKSREDVNRKLDQILDYVEDIRRTIDENDSVETSAMPGYHDGNEGIDFVRVHIIGKNHLMLGHFMEQKENRDAYLKLLLFVARCLMPYSEYIEDGLGFIERIQHSIGVDGDIKTKYTESLALKEQDIVKLIESVRKAGAVPAFTLDAMLLYKEMNPKDDKGLMQLIHVLGYLGATECLLSEAADAAEVIQSKNIEKAITVSVRWKELDMSLVIPYWGTDAEPALMNLAEKYRRGINVAKNLGVAKTLYERVYEIHGKDAGEAARKLGDIYDGEHNYEAAFGWYQKGAETGNSYVMYNLGRYYQYGHGVTQNISNAKEWYQKALERGIAGTDRNYVMSALDMIKTSEQQKKEKIKPNIEKHHYWGDW